MPHSLLLLNDRLVVLGILAVELAALLLAPHIEKELGQVEVFLLAREPVELDQSDLNLLVTGRVRPLSRTKLSRDEVGAFERPCGFLALPRQFLAQLDIPSC